MEALEGQGEQGVDGAVGNGIVVVVGMFDPGDIVSLVERGENEVRAGGNGAEVGKRVVDSDGQVGFAGLTPGGLFFAVGYCSGRYLEVRCVAQDPSSSVTLLQPTAQPTPTLLGAGQPAPVAPSAPPPEDLGVGLPDGVQSPLLTPGNAVAEATPAADGSPAESQDAPVDPAPVEPDPTSESSAEPGVEDGAAADPTDGAPEAGIPADVPNDTHPGDAPSPASAPAVSGAPDTGEIAAQSEPVAVDAADAPVPDAAGADASPTALEQLVAQAEALGVEGAQNGDEDTLREVITEKGETPVA